VGVLLKKRVVSGRIAPKHGRQRRVCQGFGRRETLASQSLNGPAPMALDNPISNEEEYSQSLEAE
jgi:hypothetical protein